MAFPELDTARIQAANTITQAKTMINRLKNHLAPESSEMAELIAYRAGLPDGAWKNTVTAALVSLNNIYTAITDEGL